MSKIRIQKSIKNKGFSLIEMIIYVAIMAMILVVIVNMLSVMILSQKKIKSHRIIEHSVNVAFERMTREIKSAESIDFNESVFGGNPGKLVLNTYNQDGGLKQIEFFIENGILKFKDGDLVGPLVDQKSQVANLIFYNLAEGNVRAVRIMMSISAGNGQFQKTETFYTGATIRN